MAHGDRLTTRVAAMLRGEVRADTAEALRRAGIVVHDDLRKVEDARAGLMLAGVQAWSPPPAVAAQRLCTWNAFVLQTLGERLIDADYEISPRTAGFLPPVTSEQVGRLFGQVEGWLSLARRAAADSGYRVDAELSLPADLPDWVTVEPCPPAHLSAMLAAGAVVQQHAQLALYDLEKAGVPEENAVQLGTLRQLGAQADTAFQFAGRLYQPGANVAVHEAAEDALHRALEACYHLGQLTAMPALIEHYRVDARLAASTSRRAAPGEEGFDPWVLTDPASRSGFRADRRAVRAVHEMWRRDPDPRATLAVQAQIDAAAATGDVAIASARDGQRLGHYFCCPWPAVYEVRRPSKIGDRLLRTGERFTFEVSAEEMDEGGAFVRRILVAAFQPTVDLDYCDGDGDGDGDGDEG